MSTAFAGVGLVDIAMLAAILLSVVVGLVRGLVFEVLSLVGWVVAYLVASWFATDAQAWLPMLQRFDPVVRHAIALALLFVGALVTWTLAARLVRMLVRATPLSLIDRVGGGAFGVLRGVVLLLVLATVVRYTPASQSLLWTTSVGAAWLDAVVSRLEAWLPGEVGPWLPAVLRDGSS
jgi:membrane protein required for colicin V production